MDYISITRARRLELGDTMVQIRCRVDVAAKLLAMQRDMACSRGLLLDALLTTCDLVAVGEALDKTGRKRPRGRKRKV